MTAGMSCRKAGGKNKAAVSVETHKHQLTMVLSKDLLKLLRRFQADAVKVPHLSPATNFHAATSATPYAPNDVGQSCMWCASKFTSSEFPGCIIGIVATVFRLQPVSDILTPSELTCMQTLFENRIYSSF
jgi:hypothetical protein